MAKIINIASKLVVMHANDLLDQSIIQRGNFMPAFKFDCIADAVTEVVETV